MKLADKPCYAVIGDSQTQNFYQEGLTFKERLIIALASNPKLVYEENHITSKLIDIHKTAMNMNKQAEAIIKLMEVK